MQEIVCLCFSSGSVQSIGFCEKRGICDWRWGCSSDNVKLGVTRDETGEKGKSLLMRQVTKETREESLSLSWVDDGDEWMWGTAGQPQNNRPLRHCSPDIKRLHNHQSLPNAFDFGITCRAPSSSLIRVRVGWWHVSSQLLELEHTVVQFFQRIHHLLLGQRLTSDTGLLIQRGDRSSFGFLRSWNSKDRSRCGSIGSGDFTQSTLQGRYRQQMQNPTKNDIPVLIVLECFSTSFFTCDDNFCMVEVPILPNRFPAGPPTPNP